MVLMFLGASTTLMNSLAMKILGIGILTFGYFGCHSIISAWVGRIASHDKAQASSLYLFFYYAGSSVGGTVSGLFLESNGWTGVISVILVFVTTAFMLTLLLSKKLGKN
jgi:YNFM family putative membrane transporter